MDDALWQGQTQGISPKWESSTDIKFITEVRISFVFFFQFT